MDLARVAARLRPRTSYEAIDLGFVLARHFWKPLVIAWLVCVLPVVLGAAIVAALTPLFWLPLVLIWACKPLYDRPALFVLSRAFFGDVPDLKRTVDHAMKSWRSGSAAADMSWRRFSVYRGVTMPVRELERLGGGAARERLSLLLRTDMQAPSTWLLGVAWAAEWMLVAAGLALLAMIIPQTVEFDIAYQAELLFDLEHNSPVAELIIIGVYFVAMSVVELFYLAGSFGLYINRRVRLEGWDIEIVFRKLAQRMRARDGSAARTAAALLLAGVVGLASVFAPAPLIAQQHPQHQPQQYQSQPDQPQPQQTQQSGARQADPQQVIDEILEAPEFGSTSTETKWKLKDDILDTDEPDKPSFLAEWGASIAAVVKILLWVVAGAAVVAAIVYFVRYLRRLDGDTSVREQPAPAKITELDVADEPRRVTLPANLVEAAIARWQEGAHADSLSILYRGTIRGLAHGYGIEIDPSYTARECIEKVRTAGGPADYVAELAEAWTATVYADRRPDDERARELFASWKHHFRGG